MSNASKIVRAEAFEIENELNRLRALLCAVDDALVYRGTHLRGVDDDDWSNRTAHLTGAAIDQVDALLSWAEVGGSPTMGTTIEVRMLRPTAAAAMQHNQGSQTNV